MGVIQSVIENQYQVQYIEKSCEKVIQIKRR